jgi:muconolactone delta-isomerase
MEEAGGRMRLVAIERAVPGATPDRFTDGLLVSEARRVWRLTQEGTIREVYFRADADDAVLILECPDVGAAEAALASLPLVETGLIRFELIPLRPYPGFERLFSPTPGR